MKGPWLLLLCYMRHDMISTGSSAFELKTKEGAPECRINL